MDVGSIPVAFLAGFVSFLAPCVLPLVPGYLSAVSAVEADKLGQPGTSRRVVVASLPFVLGFTAFFVALGIGAALVGGSLFGDQFLLEKVAGFILVVFGLAFMGLLPWPERLVGAGLLQGARSRGSRVLLGGAFAVCAAPCIGPVLASILVLAGSADTVVEGGSAARRLLARSRRALRPHGCGVHPRDGRVSLDPRPLPGDPGRRRRDHGRPRSAPLLRALLRAARVPQSVPRTGSASSRRSRRRPPRDRDRRRRHSASPAATCVQNVCDVDAAMLRPIRGRAGVPLSRAAARIPADCPGPRGARRRSRGRVLGGSRAPPSARRATRPPAPRVPRSRRRRADELEPALEAHSRTIIGGSGRAND